MYMLLRRKYAYALWRCALVCERFWRCEPWRPWRLGVGGDYLTHRGAHYHWTDTWTCLPPSLSLLSSFYVLASFFTVFFFLCATPCVERRRACRL